MTYVYQEFPKAKYHPKKGYAEVHDAKEEAALGKGWFDYPDFTNRPSPVEVLKEIIKEADSDLKNLTGKTDPPVKSESD